MENNLSIEQVVAELRRSLAWMDLVFAHLKEGVAVVDENMKLIFANDAFANMVNKPRVLLMGSSLWEHLKVSQGGRFMENDKNFQKVSPENIDKISGIYELKSDHRLTILEIGVGYIPKIEQAIFVVRDITEQKQAEENLKKAKDKIEEDKAMDEATLASIGDAMLTVDKEGKITFINKIAENILSCKASTIIGTSIFDLFQLEDSKGKILEQAERPISISLSKGEKITSNDYSICKGGGKIPVAMTVSPIIYNRTAIGAVQIFRDISQERDIDKAKSEFVSLASHQLRTPLTAINWYTEMLLDGDSGEINEEQKQYLKEIYSSTKRMVDLVNALLNVSRIDLGTLAITPEPTNLVEVTESVLAELKPNITAKEIELLKDFDKNLPLLNGDPKLIRIIFQNLLSNSVKYSPAKAKITIKMMVVDQHILMQFSDTGYGIPKRQHDKIFSKLFRADNVVVKETEGTGLGLYLVKAIIEQAGGEITFESEENKGTTFYIKIPVEGMKAKQGLKTLIT